MPTVASRLRAGAAAGGGAALGGLTAVASRMRRAEKPLHPRGELCRGTLRRHGATPPAGVSWLDEPGEDEVLVRRSRAVGLPEPLPDVFGLAIRVPVPTGWADLLLATTGLGEVTRFVLTCSRSPYRRPLTTLLPYRTAQGPLLIAAMPLGEHTYELACARTTGSWRPFAALQVQTGEAADPLVSFDPVRNTVPGLDHYGWVRRLREPAYEVARDRRPDDDPVRKEA